MRILLILFCSILTQSAIAQAKDFIQIETNEVLCIFSFLEAGSGARQASVSYQEYILGQLKEDTAFMNILADYQSLTLEHQMTFQEYPETRHAGNNSKDLLWIAASQSTSIDDLQNRALGFLPYTTLIQFIDCIKRAAPYYRTLIWNPQQDNIRAMEAALATYTDEVGALFLKISKFYGSNWSTDIPFRILLYPIPLAQGNIVAVPKGNALICSFLTDHPNGEEGLIGVAVHEMCHILYDAQPLILQQELEEWFSQSQSPYAKLAYTYLDEGLATVLGNGWAYEQINGQLDTADWYNDPYIDGFAHSLLDQTRLYLEKDQQIDAAFVDGAIERFAATFPNAIYQPRLLLNEIRLYVNSETEAAINTIADLWHGNIKTMSMWLAAPITSPETAETVHKQQVTKVFLVEKDHANTLKTIQSFFPNEEKILLDPAQPGIYSFKHSESKSVVIVINAPTLPDIERSIQKLAETDVLEFGTLVTY